MYLYVYDQNVYEKLTQLGKKYFREFDDINGTHVWVFIDDDDEKFDLVGGYIRSPELHMAF